MPAQLAVEMTGDEVKLFRSVQKLVAQQTKLEGGLKKTGRAGQAAAGKITKSFNKSSDAVGGKMMGAIGDVAGKLVGVAAGAALIGKAISGVVADTQKWFENMKKVSNETRKAQQDMIAFAALQAGGTKRDAVLQAGNLAAKFGVTDRALAFDTVQSLQSARGSLKAGLSASETVFAGAQVGLPVELGKELEIIGAALKLEPGVAARQAFVAGQETGRSPVEVAQAAKGLKFFKGAPEQGFAAAGIISEEAGKETGTVFRAAGIALSESASPEFRKSLRGLGVSEEATAFERLQALKKAGVTSTEQLSAIGLKQINQASGVSSLLKDLPRLQALSETIKQKAVPGLFGTQREDIEAEFPEARLERLARQQEVLRSNDRVLGPRAQRAQKVELGRSIVGQAFENLDARSFFGKSTVDEQGRATDFGGALFASAKSIPGPFSTGRNEFDQALIDEVRRLSDAIGKLDATTADTNGALRGGGGVVGPPQPASGTQGEG